MLFGTDCGTRRLSKRRRTTWVKNLASAARLARVATKNHIELRYHTGSTLKSGKGSVMLLTDTTYHFGVFLTEFLAEVFVHQVDSECTENSFFKPVFSYGEPVAACALVPSGQAAVARLRHHRTGATVNIGAILGQWSSGFFSGLLSHTKLVEVEVRTAMPWPLLPPSKAL